MNEQGQGLYAILCTLRERELNTMEIHAELKQNWQATITQARFLQLLTQLEQRQMVIRHPHEQGLALYSLSDEGRHFLAHALRDGLVYRKENSQFLLNLLFYCYPKAWRERYQDEMSVLLEEHRLTPRTIFDLLLGVLDARFDPHYRPPLCVPSPHHFSL